MNPGCKSWPASVPRRLLFPAVRSGARTAQIGRAAVYETCTQKLAGERATSPAFPGRSIGRTDGPDRANRGIFAKKPSTFSRINPQSRPPLLLRRASPSCSSLAPPFAYTNPSGGASRSARRRRQQQRAQAAVATALTQDLARRRRERKAATRGTTAGSSTRSSAGDGGGVCAWPR